jgi:hypothetical protein
MSDEKQPQVSYGDAVAMARKGMRLKAIAARAGMTLEQLKVRMVAIPQFAIDIELAYADYEEEKRQRIEQIEQEAIAAGELSLQYKMNREAIKELADRDNADKTLRVAVVQDGGLVEPEYESYSEEELAAIRVRTESEANDE